MRGRAAETLASEVIAGKYYAGTQQMLPDDSLEWGIHELPDIEGHLLLPENFRRSVVNRLVKLALRVPTFSGLSRVGGFAHVRRVGHEAYKVFDRNNVPSHAGILPLQANAALAEGLKRKRPIIGDWRLVAPKQLGAILRHGSSMPSVWAMTYESGQTPLDNDWLRSWQEQREQAYQEALAACGVDTGVVVLDEKPENMLVRQSSVSEARFEAVKFDLFVIKSAKTLEST